MPYLVINNFARGMDRRRKIYATEQGAVWDIKNAHLSRGGDIEKRKAFVAVYSLPAGTKGLSSVGGVLTVFGHDEDPGVPSGVTYQELGHTSAISRILSISGFDGLNYVVALHEDDAVRHYYDGTYASGVPGTYSFTLGTKNYVTDGSVLRFSAINDPVDFTTGTGYGSINMSNHDEGSESLLSIEVFQGNLAVFANSAIQIWSVSADPLSNVNLQTLSRTGTQAARSVLSYGEVDTFYLNRSGIRSIRARSNTNAGYVNDVGIALDAYVQEHLATLTTDEISRAVAAIDDDGRFWMAVKDKIFVLSYFPGSKISGWTWYEPGFDVDDIAVLEGRIYVRSGDTIYLYGGISNAAYESCQVVVQMPFLDAGKPGNMRNLEGMDIASEGDWLCELLVDPRDTSRKVQVGYLSGNTWLNMNSAGYASTSHFAPRLTSVSDGYVSLSAISVSFTGTADEK
jgi:hypothetical protein